ncbi:MAG TPA: zinc-binding dehydrogenase [Chloroflexota bacterium]
MQAVVKYAEGPGNVGLREMPEPEVRPGHAIIQVEAAGICGTDLHIQSAEYPCTPPVILGHEFSGTVAETGAGVDAALRGRRVTCMPYFTTCGHCEFCRSDQPNLCAERKSVGSGVNGAFASYVLVPERSIRLLPDSIDFVAGAVTEPLACCVKAVFDKSVVRPGDVAVVTGPGTIGLLAAQVALAWGATVVLAGTAADAPRMALAKRLGIQHTVDVETGTAAGLVKELTGGAGAAVAYECSGAAAGARLAIDLLKRRGQYVQIGLFGRRIEWDPDVTVLKEIDIRTTFASTPPAWDVALRLVAEGKVQTRPLVTDLLPLSEWESGFDRFRGKQGIKHVLTPKGAA